MGLGDLMRGFSTFGLCVIGTYTIGIVVCFVCVFCDTSEGMLGRMSTVLTEDVPRGFGNGLKMCIGERAAKAVTGCISRSGNYVVNERNPLLQIFYLAIVLGAYSLVVRVEHSPIIQPILEPFTRSRANQNWLQLLFLSLTTLVCFSGHLCLPHDPVRVPAELAQVHGLSRGGRQPVPVALGVHGVTWNHHDRGAGTLPVLPNRQVPVPARQQVPHGR